MLGTQHAPAASTTTATTQKRKADPSSTYTPSPSSSSPLPVIITTANSTPPSRIQTPIPSPTRLDSALSLMSLRNGGTPIHYIAPADIERPLKKQSFDCISDPSGISPLDGDWLMKDALPVLSPSYHHQQPLAHTFRSNVTTPPMNPDLLNVTTPPPPNTTRMTSKTSSPASSEASSSEASSSSSASSNSDPVSARSNFAEHSIQIDTVPVAPPPSPSRNLVSPVNTPYMPKGLVSPRSRDATITKYVTSPRSLGSGRDSNRQHPYHIHQQLFPPLASTSAGSGSLLSVAEPVNSDELRRRLKIVKKERGQLSLPDGIKSNFRFVF